VVWTLECAAPTSNIFGKLGTCSSSVTDVHSINKVLHVAMCRMQLLRRPALQPYIMTVWGLPALRSSFNWQNVSSRPGRGNIRAELKARKSYISKPLSQDKTTYGATTSRSKKVHRVSEEIAIISGAENCCCEHISLAIVQAFVLF